MPVSLVYGPVPSRRLGRSLGVNNIPPKICSYNCVYCQIGKTRMLEVNPRPFYEVDMISDHVQEKLGQAAMKGEKVDYITFVPDGETTLDINLGAEIDMVKSTGIPVAVISNASLLWQQEVRQNLLNADWISLKVDSVSEKNWQRIDRPHKSLRINDILDGISGFARVYKGKLTTETMLVRGINDSPAEIEKITKFIAGLRPSVSYLAIPIRPPSEQIEAPDEAAVNQAYQILRQKIPYAEYLIGYEGDSFASTGKVEEDLLSITSVHPMRQDAVIQFLQKTGSDWNIVAGMLDKYELVETEYRGDKFYMRKLPEHDSV